MALKNVLPLDPVVNIIVNLSAVSATRKKFNVALLVGDVGDVADFENARVVTYDSLTSILQAGFEPTSRIYKAAALIFGQAKVPPTVAIGKIVSTTIAGERTYTVTTNAEAGDTVTLEGITLTEGTDFTLGENISDTVMAIVDALKQNTTFNALYNVVATGVSFTVTEKTAGQGYTPGEATTTGVIVIESGEPVMSETQTESPMESIRACREADGEWYIANYCGDLTHEQILDIMEYVEAVTPSTVFVFTNSEEVSKTSDGGIFGELKSRNYRRAFGQYSTSHEDAVCAIIGWAMGAMTATTIDSAFTLAYKTEKGVQTENTVQTFTTNAVNNIKNNYGNVFINRGVYYDIFEEGRMTDGSWFDEIIFLDKYKNEMQLTIMDLLYTNNKIAQTEAGMTRIKNALQVVCDDMNRINFVKGGVWLGGEIMSLKYGDTLPNGYLIQSEPMASQSQADRDARIAPPIYVSLKLAGAIHHVTVQVDVNR